MVLAKACPAFALRPECEPMKAILAGWVQGIVAGSVSLQEPSIGRGWGRHFSQAGKNGRPEGNRRAYFSPGENSCPEAAGLAGAVTLFSMRGIYGQGARGTRGRRTLPGEACRV